MRSTRLVADGLRAVAVRLPVDEAVAVIESGGDFLRGADGVIDDLGDLLPLAVPVSRRSPAPRASSAAAAATAPRAASAGSVSAGTPFFATSSGCRAMCTLAGKTATSTPISHQRAKPRVARGITASPPISSATPLARDRLAVQRARTAA